MFEIGQHVIHPGQGVCTATGFTDDTAHPMILLRAKSGHAETHLMYPLAQQSRLHAIISREDAEDLIDSYADLTVDSFTERNSALEETHFKQQLKLGAPETVRVAKTMRHRIAEAEAHGKKPSSYYSRMLKEARRRTLEELSVALGADEDAVEERFKEAIIQAGEIPALN